MHFLVGPTAVGKTDIAAEIAARIDAEIVSADAFQIYRGLDILTAKPSPDLLAKIPHHLIGEISLTQNFDVAQFEKMARQRMREIAARGKRVLVVGGTGLYIRALTHGLNDLPQADATLRAQLEALSHDELAACLAELDAHAMKWIDLKNKRRVIRAVEVCLLTGKPFSSFRDKWKNSPREISDALEPSRENRSREKFSEKFSGALLMRNRDELYSRIDARARQMFENGVVEEVRALDNNEIKIGATASQVIGLREIRALIRGELSEAECIAKIQLSTRRYAKRQMTWFRRDSVFMQIDLTNNRDSRLVSELIAQKFLSADSR